MIYLDTNVVLAAVEHADEGRSEAVARFFRKQGAGELCVSPLTLYEARNRLYSLPDPSEPLALLDSLKLSFLRVLPEDWTSAIEAALRLAAKYRARLAVDSADTLHVGWALAKQCRGFASFDRAKGPRALAYCEGLRVWPDMTASDWEQRKRLT